jgi:hypothetical protein
VSRRARLLVLVAVCGVATLVAWLVAPGSQWPGLAILGGAIAVGELVELRPAGRAALPMSFAFVVVLARRADEGEAVLVLAIAMLAALACRGEPRAFLVRVGRTLGHVGAGLGCIAVYHLVMDAMGEATRGGVLLALTVAALVPIVVTDVAAIIWSQRPSAGWKGRSADLAIASSAVLMAVADQGVNGNGGMGLWGPAVFTIPLLAAWYAYERLTEIRRTFDQTIRALGAAPELGGVVLQGHAERVASLSSRMGEHLGLSHAEVDHLQSAALLHHLGQVCIDEPEDGRRPEAAAIAEAGAAILRTAQLLAPAGDILAAEAMPTLGPAGAERHVALSGQILKVASAFDELSEGRPELWSVALETLVSGPAYLYDNEVLGALEAVLDRDDAL